jgi:hypothetical protein
MFAVRCQLWVRRIREAKPEARQTRGKALRQLRMGRLQSSLNRGGWE